MNNCDRLKASGMPVQNKLITASDSRAAPASSRRRSVFLDIPSYRTGLSSTGNRRKPVDDNKTYQDLAGLTFGYVASARTQERAGFRAKSTST
jgi:hypothetical protein